MSHLPSFRFRKDHFWLAKALVKKKKKIVCEINVIRDTKNLIKISLLVYLTEIRIYSSDDKPSTESSLFSKVNPIGDNERQKFEEGDKVSDPETSAGGDPSQQVPEQRVPSVCSEKQEEIRSTDGGCEASEKTIAASSDPDSLLARIDRGQNAENVLKREATAESMSPLGMSEVRTTRTSSSCLNFLEGTLIKSV